MKLSIYLEDKKFNDLKNLIIEAIKYAKKDLKFSPPKEVVIGSQEYFRSYYKKRSYTKSRADEPIFYARDLDMLGFRTDSILSHGITQPVVKKLIAHELAHKTLDKQEIVWCLTSESMNNDEINRVAYKIVNIVFDFGIESYLEDKLTQKIHDTSEDFEYTMVSSQINKILEQHIPFPLFYHIPYVVSKELVHRNCEFSKIYSALLEKIEKRANKFEKKFILICSNEFKKSLKSVNKIDNILKLLENLGIRGKQISEDYFINLFKQNNKIDRWTVKEYNNGYIEIYAYEDRLYEFYPVKFRP